MEADTKPKTKTCSKCDAIKCVESFIQNKKVCKECRNEYTRTRYKNVEKSDETLIKCNNCDTEMPSSEIVKNRKVCKKCNNEKRRNKYASNDDLRKKLIEDATAFKQKRLAERRQKQEEELEQLEQEIGKENTICKYCKEVKPKTRFRFNRLKCADCERDEPLEKFKRSVRSRIYIALNKKKNKHTIDYLGCNSEEYLKWLEYNNSNYTLNNRGKDWHIDHVIPLSKFNLDDEKDHQLAFNWRNTTALSPKENLEKNNKIIPSQIENHLNKLTIYHKENNIELPPEYINLLAKHLVAGSPLEPNQSNKLDNHYQVCDGNTQMAEI